MGKALPGDLRTRGAKNLEHRLSCGWLKFNTLAPTLLNRKIDLKLRLRLFHSCVSPSVLYSLATTPLTSAQVEKLNATQRIMLRKIVGWVRWDEESWHEIGHRMKKRLERAMELYPMETWGEARDKHREHLIFKMDTGCCPHLLLATRSWNASSRRPRGRPRQRWTD